MDLNNADTGRNQFFKTLNSSPQFTHNSPLVISEFNTGFGSAGIN